MARADPASTVPTTHQIRPGLSPFGRLRELLCAFEPPCPPLDLALGEPQMAVPTWIGDSVVAAQAEFSRYPAIKGSATLRGAIADWLSRHHHPIVTIDPECHVLPCSGAREGLFVAILYAVRRHLSGARPAVLFPDPSYPVYPIAAVAAGAEPVALPATAASGYLPDLAALANQHGLLARTAVLVIGSPANPQGAVADSRYLAAAAALARLHDFVLICDECYSEVFTRERPVSALACADGLRNVLVFNSLSKRSGLPGLRSGFCAGDPELISALGELRNLIGPQMPGPLQHASALAWADEAIVTSGRELHRERIAAAERQLGEWPGFRVPAGGFFLWLDVTPWIGTVFAQELWHRAGVRVLPGAFLVHADDPGESVGRVRIALVHPPAEVDHALSKVADLLGEGPPEAFL